MPPFEAIHGLSLALLIIFSVVTSSHQSIGDFSTFSDFDITNFGIDSGHSGDGGVDEESVIATGGPIGDASIIQAVALLRGPKTLGVVRLVQVDDGPTQISGFVKGLFPLGQHGFHVHQHRVLGGNCESAGEHYNPTKQTHGSPHSPASHIGDLGNLVADAKGTSQFEVSSVKISLRGKFSVLERSLVVHLRPDDMGMGYNRESLQSGNSGARIACGTIKFVSIKKT